MSSIASEVEMALKILALVSAGGFFLWKALTGWRIINLKLSLKVARMNTVFLQRRWLTK